jgi:hypothetical protein
MSRNIQLLAALVAGFALSATALPHGGGGHGGGSGGGHGGGFGGSHGGGLVAISASTAVTVVNRRANLTRPLTRKKHRPVELMARSAVN